MALAVSEPVAALFSTTNGTSYALGAFTPTADSFLALFVFASGTLTASPAVSGGGLTWTQREANQFDGSSSSYLYTAPVGGSPASTTITFTCTDDAATGCILMVLQFTGQDTAAPYVKSAQGENAASADPTVTFASALSTDNAYAFGFAIFRTAPAGTPPASWTEVNDSGITGPAFGACDAYRVNGESGTTVTYTAATGSWAALAVEVAVAPSVGGQPTMRRWGGVPGMRVGR